MGADQSRREYVWGTAITNEPHHSEMPALRLTLTLAIALALALTLTLALTLALALALTLTRR